MRIVFMGTGEIGVPCLEELLASGHEVVGVVTQPDRPVGRHQEMTPPRVKVIAGDAGIPVLQPERLRGKEAREDLAALRPDVVVVVAYGQILSRRVLEIPPQGCINVHASLLPRHRGASCLQAAILDGDPESGVTIMHMAEGLDTGDVILRRSLELAADETGGSLHDRVAEIAPAALGEALAMIEEGTAPREPQEEAEASYAPKLKREDGELDWTRTAVDLERQVRAYHPWPGTYTWFQDARGRDRRLKVFPGTEVAAGSAAPGIVDGVTEAAVVVGCGEGTLALTSLQPDGAKRMTAAEFLTGHGVAAGDRFFSLANQGESTHP